MPSIRDAPTIPATLDDVLISRLSRVPDEASVNWSMFRFLAERASDKVFERVIGADDELLRREAWQSYRASHDPKVLVHARAHRLGRLDEYDQNETTARLRRAALDDFDLSFFEEADILRLIPPAEVVALGIKLRSEALVEAPLRIEKMGKNADLNDDPETHFEHYSRGLQILESFEDLDAPTESLIRAAKQAISQAIAEIAERKEAEDKPDHSAEWNYMSPLPRDKQAKPAPTASRSRRSIFEDVDADAGQSSSKGTATAYIG
jgi:hypothetical protein